MHAGGDSCQRRFQSHMINNWERVAFHNVEAKGDIKEVPGALDACREAGGRLVVA